MVMDVAEDMLLFGQEMFGQELLLVGQELVLFGQELLLLGLEY